MDDVIESLMLLQIKMEDVPLTDFVRDTGSFPERTVGAVKHQAYECTIVRLAHQPAGESLGCQCKWPTISSPSATAAGLLWSKALDPLLTLCLCNHWCSLED
ncbi:unnamed protein product [Pleuronectes platessa]|uniref:Uncharacterized protein n=1 Tax=Pleuronectes platessa TaxID=8262 RepID=A0A9N7U685_PLEPL|nr:unnamed protein product [Pleuronectes platessa]